MLNFDSLFKNFLGSSTNWYKWTIISFLILNPILFFTVSPFIAGWALVLEFILTLAMALKCYPLQPGGLLALEAVIIGMTSPHRVAQEIMANFEVVLLLMFMVAGIYFMKNLLLFVFTRLLLNIRSKIVLSLAFCFSAAFLSAFLDALTVIAVIITVSMGFYGVYHKVASGLDFHEVNDVKSDDKVHKQEILENFRAFLRSLLMHSAVGTALGGVMTIVGEPQNLIIAEHSKWTFVEFFLRMSPVTIPILISGMLTCFIVEKLHLLGYGEQLPEEVCTVLKQYAEEQDAKMTQKEKANLVVQALIGIWLIVGLAFHLADVGLIGLSVIILTTTFCGVIDEHQIGPAFKEGLPFTALLVVFFAIVGIIVDQKLFAPLITFVLEAAEHTQVVLFYIFNGILSAISGSLLGATIYINEAKLALESGSISREQFNLIAVAVNTGSNIPSLATPNGQAALLFLLTSPIAPLIRLSYGRMMLMALPYTIVLSIVGLIGVMYLPEATIALGFH